MIRAAARLATPQAAKYLGQLCKHFAHKVPVRSSEAEGLIEFQAGSARLWADGDALRIEVEAIEAAGLNQVEKVVESHLMRFAFREQVGALSWSNGGVST